MPAPGALPEQAAKRHVATAGIDQGLQISVALVVARFARQPHADVARAQRGAWCRQSPSGRIARVVPHRRERAAALGAATLRQIADLFAPGANTGRTDSAAAFGAADRMA